MCVVCVLSVACRALPYARSVWSGPGPVGLFAEAISGCRVFFFLELKCFGQGYGLLDKMFNIRTL